MSPKQRKSNEAGVALLTTLLVLMLISALMAGIFAAVQSDLREAATDRDQTQAYAAAHAGLEQLTAGLAELFLADVSPSTGAINAVAAAPPSIPGFEFTSPGGGSGFTISYLDANSDGTPDILPNTAITTGPFTGFLGLITPYTMTVTAKSTSGKSEVRLRRGLQTVAVPVFQFGMFSESDLSIFAGGGFRFGGRVHTNGSLFVAAQTNSSSAINITFNDRITAVNEVIRNYLSNGRLASTTSPSFNNEVRIPTSSSTTDVLKQSPNMGSVDGMPGSTKNDNWVSISTGTFKSYVRTSATGARRLDLPLVSQGATPVDLIRRPPLTAVAADPPLVLAQRYFKQASLRILLSDRPADITGLPTVTATAPVLLNSVNPALDGSAAGSWTVAPPAGYTVDASHPPIARSMGPAATETAGGGGAPSSGWVQIPVNNALGIPAVWKLPSFLEVWNSTQTLKLQDVRCHGKTGSQAVTSAPTASANAFVDCKRWDGTAEQNLLAIPIGSKVRTTVDGRSVVATVTTAVTAGSGFKEILVGANETAPFSANLYWMNVTDATSGINASVPVTCQGYRDQSGSTVNNRLINCKGQGITAAVASGLKITTSAQAGANTGTIGGYIKIEQQTAGGAWVDVTMEILNLGIGAPNSGGVVCDDPTPTAVLRIQRLRDNGATPGSATDKTAFCTYNNSQNSSDWWPQALYDAREGSFRDSATTGSVHTQTSPMRTMGVMQYVSLDVRNLKRWLAGEIGASGPATLNDDGNGYVVYFSDRRGNHDTTAAGDPETGELGFEDQINSTTNAGLPDGALQAGEDVNGNGTQQLYGAVPWNNAVNVPPGTAAGSATTPYSQQTKLDTPIPYANGGGSTGADGAGVARVNKVLHFRRALKLVNGGIVSGVSALPDDGLTVAAENPVYVHGNYNASTTEPNTDWSNVEPNRPASVVADAISLLSNNWSDALSFLYPNYMPSREASQTSYRFGAIAGKGLSFPYCGGSCGNPGDLFGTDGGAGNFFRLLEDWGATGATGTNTAIRYRGSIVSLHINRQAIGAYKFAGSNNHTYNAGPRNFTYDVDFLIPEQLPPATPMFRDINTLQFRQILRPNQ